MSAGGVEAFVGTARGEPAVDTLDWARHAGRLAHHVWALLQPDADLGTRERAAAALERHERLYDAAGRGTTRAPRVQTSHRQGKIVGEGEGR